MSNLDKVQKEQLIELGGKTLKLVFNLLALARVERKSGKTVGNLMQEGSMEGVLLILWAALQKHHPELTEDEVGEMVSVQDIPALMETITKCFAASAPAPEDGEKEAKKAEGQ